MPMTTLNIMADHPNAGIVVVIFLVIVALICVLGDSSGVG